jgi:redox-sensitive bicupin YhaK (pirin superfamily)
MTTVQPQIEIRRAQERGRTNIDWLKSWHSFSFGQYRDPKHMGFATLRVINDDIIAPGGGFGTHPHDNMEILTWVLDGALAHQDSTGRKGIIKHGDLQVMSAGHGIEHSEKNASNT